MLMVTSSSIIPVAEHKKENRETFRVQGNAARGMITSDRAFH